MKTFVQGKDELDVGKARDFIESCDNAKLVLVHCSVRDEKTSERFFKELINEVDTPFLGVRVDGTATRKGFYQDVFTYAVLCGDFEVEVHEEKINYDDLDETADNIAAKVGGWELCITYSSNIIFDGVKIDYILRRVQERNPNTQIAGAVSASKPTTATKKELSENKIIYALIKGVEFDFHMDSGFQLDENSDLEFEITKADDFHIYEINGKNAVEEYCRIQHIRPYMLNKIMELSIKPGTVALLKTLSELNEVLYEGVLKTIFNILGTEIQENLVEPVFIFKAETEETKKYIVTGSHKPEGTLLKRMTTTKKQQLEIYNKITQKHPQTKAMIIDSCSCRQFWYNFDQKALKKELKKINKPFIMSLVFGEFGAKLPYKNKKTNLLNLGTIKAIVFK